MATSNIPASRTRSERVFVDCSVLSTCFDYAVTDPLWFKRPGADVSYLAFHHRNSLLPTRVIYRIPTVPEMTAPAVSGAVG